MGTKAWKRLEGGGGVNRRSELGNTHSPPEAGTQQAMIGLVGSVFKFKNMKNFKERMWVFSLLHSSPFLITAHKARFTLSAYPLNLRQPERPSLFIGIQAPGEG